MSWVVSEVTRWGSVLTDDDSGATTVVPVVTSPRPGSLVSTDGFGALVDAPEASVARFARDHQLIEVRRDDSGAALWIDHSATPRGDDLVGTIKIAAPVARQQGELLVVSGLVAIGPDDDYDSLPALAAAMIRLRVDQWLGLGIEAKALATQVGLEGSWDGESLWLDSAGDAYDYLRDWAQPDDLVLITGHRFGELPGLLHDLGVIE